MRKQQRRHIGVRRVKLPCLIFTLDQLVFLRKTLEMLEKVMLQQTRPLPNVNFALSTVTQVQAKVNQMIRLGYWGEAVALDFNEIVILQASVWVYSAALNTITPSDEEQKKQCQSLNLLLAPVTKQTGILN